jgi:UDP-2-acetamido-2,6-beta-L-arabino-hexul-4-ose reductase
MWSLRIKMRILITGSNGFIGKNLKLRLQEEGIEHIDGFERGESVSLLEVLVQTADFIIHLAGENRPATSEGFTEGNINLTQSICEAVIKGGRPIPIIFTSSLQASESVSPYAKSKQGAEDLLERLSQSSASPIAIYRLANVFGKWIRPNYNSVVGTFCHNIARDLPIHINDPKALIKLIYIDDVITDFINRIRSSWSGVVYGEIAPEYSIAVGGLAEQIKAFKESRNTLQTERVGSGFMRALYSTYISYLPSDQFSYPVPKYGDARGVFVEMLKTPDCGQFSYFTALPGVTRGSHYHHSKTEKFLVISGKARFGFRHVITDEYREVFTSGEVPQIVETLPGWAHDISNIGDNEMVVMLWANEVFDRERPDTIAAKVQL